VLRKEAGRQVGEVQEIKWVGVRLVERVNEEEQDWRYRRDVIGR